MEDDITKQHVYKINQTQKSSQITDTQMILSIVDSLGGINEIIDVCLNEMNINQPQLQQIHRILNTDIDLRNSINNASQQRTISNTSHSNGDTIEINDDGVWYYLSSNDTFLRKLFSDITADKIFNIIHGIIMRIIVLVSFIIWLILSKGFGATWAYRIYIIVICCILWIPYFSSWILSLNVTCFKLVLMSFEFWFKLFYVVQLGVLNFIYVYHLQVMDREHTFRSMIMIECMLFIIVQPLCMICISSFDAVQISKFWKVTISASFALYFGVSSIQLQFILPHNTMITIPMTNSSISLNSMFADTLKVLAIFFAKQAVLTCYRKKKAVLIKESPFIQWTRNIGDKNSKHILEKTVELRQTHYQLMTDYH